MEESLAAIGRRKLFVIPGRKYKGFVAVVTKLPIWLRLRLETGSPRGRKR